VAEQPSPARRLGVHACHSDLDLDGLGAQGYGGSGRGGRSVVDVGSCGCRPRLCCGVVRPGRRTRSRSPIAAMAGPLVVVPDGLAGTVGVRDSGCRDSGAARRAVGCSSAARADPIDSCTCVDPAGPGTHRRIRRRAWLAWLPAAPAPHPPPCCRCQPDPRALLVAVAPATGLD
jgi:hypothetical protein